MAEWGRLTRSSPKVLVPVSVVCLLGFVFSASGVIAATTYVVKVGGEYAGSPLAKGGVVWFNGYDKETIVIQPGDTVQWRLVGGIHTVTSTDMAGTAFVYDSSPLFPVEAALADMAPGRLLPPGSVYENDTTFLSPGTYAYFCKIHPGMAGNVTVTTGPVIDRIVNVVAGWGDPVYAVQAFAPENVVVPQGTIVRWTLVNPTEPHTITSSAWDSSPDLPPGAPPVMLVPGTTFNWTFTAEGTFTYFCKLHAYKIGETWVGMVGTVIVLAAPPIVVVDPSGTFAAFGYGAFALGAIALLVALYGVARRRGPEGPPPM